MLNLSINGIPKPERSQKGKSIIDFPTNYVVIDIETTGLDPLYCDIIEVSAIKYSSGAVVDRFSSLVKPPEPLDDDYITELTGITNDMLDGAPPAADVLPLFHSFIADSVLVGYNVNFDINFLYDKMLPLSLILSNSFVDVLRIARRLLPELKNHKQVTVADHFGITPDAAHRALSDCETCGNIYVKLQAEIINKYGSLDAFKASLPAHNLKASTITATTSEFDETHPLYNKVCVFTGTLEKMVRKEAMQLVVNLGGICGDSVTQKTNFLILGNNDFCASIKDGKSSKHKKAEALALKGNDIQIISENVFYDLVLNQ